MYFDLSSAYIFDICPLGYLGDATSAGGNPHYINNDTPALCIKQVAWVESLRFKTDSLIFSTFKRNEFHLTD